MAPANEYCIIGLGAFGSALAIDLYDRGHDVLGIDRNGKLVNAHQDKISQVLQADATSEEALKTAGVQEYDFVIVAIGDHIEDNILVTQTVLELGVEKVWSRAENQRHANILSKLGVERVVDPELESATRCARVLSSRSVMDFIEFSPGFSVAQIIVGSTYSGKTLKDIGFRKKFGASVIAIRRQDESIPIASPEDVIYEGDVLFVAGKTENVEAIERV